MVEDYGQKYVKFAGTLVDKLPARNVIEGQQFTNMK